MSLRMSKWKDKKMIVIAGTLTLGSCSSIQNANNQQKGTGIGAIGGAVLGGIIGNQIELDSMSFLESTVDTFFQKKGFDNFNKLSMYIPNSYNFYWNTSGLCLNPIYFHNHQYLVRLLMIRQIQKNHLYR